MSVPVRLAFMRSPSPARPTLAGADSHPSNASLGPARAKREVLLKQPISCRENGTVPAFPSVPPLGESSAKKIGAPEGALGRCRSSGGRVGALEGLVGPKA